MRLGSFLWNGKEWEIQARRRVLGGTCCGLTDYAKRKIFLELLANRNTMIHELLHVSFPGASEKKIAEAARLIDSTLRELYPE